MPKTLLKQAVVLGSSVFIISGCATILNDETQKINVKTSHGETIDATIDGRSVKVPGIVEVRREKKDKIVSTNAPECTKETMMAKQVDPKFFINILAGGVFGSTTDYSTEKMWQYDENVEISCK